MPKFLIYTLLLIGIPLLEMAQTYPKNDFRSPVDTSISLAGNFGEVRPNHFHAGFDIRTNNREGMPVFAVADGYVSRIKISPYGYGKAIYIRHPNGYTSVYGHLSVLKEPIGSFTSHCQYSKESFELDTLLPAGILPVKKGDTIALSGNTGGSQGPHLHFEIRESSSEMPVNPYEFGYLVSDTVAPRVNELVIYPISDNASINHKHQLKKIKPDYKKGKYSYLKSDTISANGTIAFGISCYDQESGSTNQNGVYSIEVQSGGKRIYFHQLEKFSFENARYVNAHIDYSEKQRNKETIQKCFLSKNNQLGIYDLAVGNGQLTITDDSVHWISFIVKDFQGNTTTLPLKIKGTSHSLKNNTPKTALSDCLIDQHFEVQQVSVDIPAGSFYDDYSMSIHTAAPAKGAFSKTVTIMNPETALQKPIQISVPCLPVTDSLKEKLCLVSVTDKGTLVYEGGKWKDGKLICSTKNLGRFRVGIDTIPPKLKPAFPTNKDSMIVDLSKQKKIGIIASDNLSGIKKYRATIDGKWVLCEYETKQDLLFYTFDEHLSRGIHSFLLEVTDDRKNTSTYFCTFRY